MTNFLIAGSGFRNVIVLVSVALLLTACGSGDSSCGGSALVGGLASCAGSGGGGGGTSGTQAPAAQGALEGVYTGTSSNGKAIDALILEDGSWWDVYGVPSGASLLVQGIATGTSTSSGGNFTISFNDFYAPGTSPVSGSGSGTYTATTILGTQTEGGAYGTFNLTAPLTTNYDYNTPANLSAITGAWTGGLLDGESATVIINSDGTFTATSSLGCSATGTVAPRASGKNVFNASLTFGAAPCALPNQTASGIALTYPLSDGTNQLIVALVNSAQTDATAFFATTKGTIPLTIGGSVTGLSGSGLVLQNNGVTDLSIAANGTFTFSGNVTTGSSYSVRVLTQPTGQSCNVANGTGTVGSSSVSNISVSCTNVTLSCASGSGGGTNGIRLYTPDNTFSYLLGTTSANALDSVTTGWGALYSGPAGSYTGSLAATLWAVSSSYSGGTIVGTILGTFVPNFTGPGAYSSSQIAAGGYSINTIVSSAANPNPSAGQYCLVLTLEEYLPGQCNPNPGGYLPGYCSVDWLQFNNTVIFQ